MKGIYETVKTVNGYSIQRMPGTKGVYHVDVKEGKGFRAYQTFRTIKAAEQFANNAVRKTIKSK